MRAYTYIDHAFAAVGNEWIERRWAALDGRTTSLLLKPVSYDWVSGRCAELALYTDEHTYSLEHMPFVEWFEENSPRGATLVVKRTGANFQHVTRTFVYHDKPCMVRAETLVSLCATPLVFSSVMHDGLALQPHGTTVRTGGFEQTEEARDWTTEERAAALTRGETGIFVGREGGGRYALFAPEPNECAIYGTEPVHLEPYEVRHLHRTYLSFFIGPIREAVNRSFADMLADLRKHDDRLAKSF